MYIPETSKSQARRAQENWFDRFAPAYKPGLDIGCGVDPLHTEAVLWWQVDQGFTEGEVAQGRKTRADASALPFDSGAFYTVYTSHLLEHVVDPAAAIREWWRVLAPGGHLIIVVPHRDLYEYQSRLPSRWNGDHKTMWLPTRSDGEKDTVGLLELVEATLPEAELRQLRVLDDNHVPPTDDAQPSGEFSIEGIWRRL